MTKIEGESNPSEYANSIKELEDGYKFYDKNDNNHDKFHQNFHLHTSDLNNNVTHHQMDGIDDTSRDNARNEAEYLEECPRCKNQLQNKHTRCTFCQQQTNSGDNQNNTMDISRANQELTFDRNDHNKIDHHNESAIGKHLNSLSQGKQHTTEQENLPNSASTRKNRKRKCILYVHYSLEDIPLQSTSDSQTINNPTIDYHQGENFDELDYDHLLRVRYTPSDQIESIINIIKSNYILNTNQSNFLQRQALAMKTPRNSNNSYDFNGNDNSNSKNSNDTRINTSNVKSEIQKFFFPTIPQLLRGYCIVWVCKRCTYKNILTDLQNKQSSQQHENQFATNKLSSSSTPSKNNDNNDNNTNINNSHHSVPIIIALNFDLDQSDQQRMHSVARDHQQFLALNKVSDDTCTNCQQRRHPEIDDNKDTLRKNVYLYRPLCVFHNATKIRIIQRNQQSRKYSINQNENQVKKEIQSPNKQNRAENNQESDNDSNHRNGVNGNNNDNGDNGNDNDNESPPAKKKKTYGRGKYPRVKKSTSIELNQPTDVITSNSQSEVLPTSNDTSISANQNHNTTQRHTTNVNDLKSEKSNRVSHRDNIFDSQRSSRRLRSGGIEDQEQVTTQATISIRVGSDYQVDLANLPIPNHPTSTATANSTAVNWQANNDFYEVLWIPPREEMHTVNNHQRNEVQEYLMNHPQLPESKEHPIYEKCLRHAMQLYDIYQSHSAERDTSDRNEDIFTLTTQMRRRDWESLLEDYLFLHSGSEVSALRELLASDYQIYQVLRQKQKRILKDTIHWRADMHLLQLHNDQRQALQLLCEYCNEDDLHTIQKAMEELVNRFREQSWITMEMSAIQDYYFTVYSRAPRRRSMKSKSRSHNNRGSNSSSSIASIEDAVRAAIEEVKKNKAIDLEALLFSVKLEEKYFDTQMRRASSLMPSAELTSHNQSQKTEEDMDDS